MSLLSWFTGGSDTADKVIDTVSAGIDMAFFTDEEKSIAASKVLDFKLSWMLATSGQNLARRIIAFAIVGLWSFIVLLAILAWPWYPDYSKYLFSVLVDVVAIPFAIIVGFYFAAHIAGKFGK